MFYSLIYLIFRACEGALGLSILVTIRRTHGGDNFNIFNLGYDKIYFCFNENNFCKKYSKNMVRSSWGG